MKPRNVPARKLARIPIGRENEYACAWNRVIVLFDEIHDFVDRDPIADSTHLEKHVQEWIREWKTAFCVQYNPFVENPDSADVVTTLCLLLPYLSCICLLFRKYSSCTRFIAASFMTGILAEIRGRNKMHFLPTFATIYFTIAAENLRSCGDDIAESAEKNFSSLVMSLEAFKRHYSGADDTVTLVQELRGEARSASQLTPITDGEKKYFVALNPEWCDVPKFCIPQEDA